MSSSRQHPSRRVNQSVSSTHSAASASSSRGDRNTRTAGNPAVEGAVTRLLISIKALLESLTKWSKQEVSEEDVSDIYVRLGNEFNIAVASFAAYNIPMNELMTVPDDLRAVLESCLSEDATPTNLEIFLPEVRNIITRLLQGLRAKQSLYRSIGSEHKHRSSNASVSDRESRASRSDSSSKHEEEATRPQATRSVTDPSEGPQRRSATPSSGRRGPSGTHTRPATNGSAASKAAGDPPSSRSSTPTQSHSYPRSQLSSEVNGLPTRSRSTSAMDLHHTNGFHEEDQTPRNPANSEQESTPVPRPPSQVPSHVKRYSLVDPPVQSPPSGPAVIVDEVAPEEPHASEPLEPPSRASPELATEPATLETPGVQNSLAALRNRDALERRASKRFSTYNISKMTGSSMRDRSGAATNANRRSMAVSSALSPGELAALTEADEEAATSSASPAKRSKSKGSQRSRNPSPIKEDDNAPPVPPLPSRDASPAAPPLPAPGQIVHAPAQSLPVKDLLDTTESEGRMFPVFLQVGREVKKAVIEPGLSVSSLRVLFVDKFSYNPGPNNFPAIYIRDPSSGVQYELEDMDEIKPKCLLSLNIEPLDQIKQHIDIQISSLAQDIKDLRTVVSSSRRASIPPPIIAQPMTENPPATARPTDGQLRSVARRLSRLMPNDMRPPITEDEQVAPQITGFSIQPQMTGASVMSEYTARVVTDLRTQFDEVQNLRRDLGIMRQLYTEFMKQTKESLGTLRTQTQNVRQLASTKVGGQRAYIDDGKTKLDARSQDVLTKIEELQDTVENIKDDVLKRNVSPKPQVLKNVKADMEAVATELQSLKEHIQTVKPMWKKTWEAELQNIVEEQQFLQHQEEFLNDLLEDQKAVVEVYGHVEKVISLRGSVSARASRARGFKPPPMDEGHTGLSTVMLEIRGAAVDPERRLKAIAANEKLREKELASRSDEFQSELSGFVVGKKLKMTGGAEETERVRQRKNDQTLKAMFTGGSSASSPPPSGPMSPAPPVE